MDRKKVINQLLLERNMELSELAVMLEMNTQSLRNKINRDTYGVKDFELILDKLGCKLQIVTVDTGKIFD